MSHSLPRILWPALAVLACAGIWSDCIVGADDGADDEWPEFRGPLGTGHSTATRLPTTWSEKHNVVWRTAVAGRGWSSPVVDPKYIWLTAALEREPTEEQLKKAKADNAADQQLKVVGNLSMRVVAVDRRNGSIQLDRELMVEPNPDPVHATNSFASPTPVLSDGLLYCHFGANGTACVDTRNGEVVWRNRDLRIKHENGAGSSPVIWKNQLIFHCDGSDEQYIVALNKRTGNLAWKTPRSGKLNDNPQLKKAYGTPLIVPIDGQPVLLSPGADWLYAYDPQDGRELWKLSYEAQGFSIVPRPVSGHGMLFFSTSFMQAEMLAVKLETPQPEIAWRYKKQAPQMSSPLLIGEELYFVSDRGIATCLDARTGDVHWSERLGGYVCSSPMYADGKIYVGNREGACFVLEPGKTFHLLATNSLTDGGSIMATPAALGNAIYLRTEKALYRLENTAGS